MKRKQSVYRGLEFIPVYFEDNSLTSPDYFQITEFPTKLTAGKNLFKLRGHPTNLRVGGALGIEVLDFNGDPIYHEVINYIDEDKSRVISIYIYEETPPGDCTITLIAEAESIEGQIAPTQWQGKANIRWTRSIPVNPNISNNSEIIFESPPAVNVTEQIGVQLNRTYPNNDQFPQYSTGNIRYFSFNNQPAFELIGGELTAEMANGTLTVAAPSNPTPTPTYTVNTTAFTSQIKKILTTGSALLDTEYTVYSSQSITAHTYNAIDPSAFTIDYEATPTYISTENSQSFAYIQVNGLDPATGDISRIKVFTNNNGTSGTWDLVNDIELEETEILIASTSSLLPDETIGLFTSQSLIDYWEGHTYSGFTEGTPPTLIWSTGSLANAGLISSSTDISANNQVHVLQVKSGSNGIFVSGSAYKVRFDAIGKRSNLISSNQDPKLSVYLSGSAFDFDSTDFFNQELPVKLGKKVGDVTIDTNSQRLDDKVFSFESDNSGFGSLLFVVHSGIWQIADVHVTSDNDSGYSPNYTRIKTPIETTHKINNQISFKLEYYNVAGERSKQVSYIYNKNWQGGNRYIDGDYSLMTGSLYVADSLNSGVAISGYPNSGFIRSLGYEGFDSGFPGFLLWSGSALPGQKSKYGNDYDGVGLELYANTGSYFRYSTFDDELDVRTTKFFLGHPSSSFISGSNGNIEISSSNFHLTAEGNITASNALFTGTARADIILDKTVAITAANSGSYLQSFTTTGTSQAAYRLVLDGSLGGERVRRVDLNCNFTPGGTRTPIGEIKAPNIGNDLKVSVIITNITNNDNSILNIFDPAVLQNIGSGTYPASGYDEIVLKQFDSIELSLISSNTALQTAGTTYTTPFIFKTSAQIGDGTDDSNFGILSVQNTGVPTSATTATKGPRLHLQVKDTFSATAADQLVFRKGLHNTTNTVLSGSGPYWGIWQNQTTRGDEVTMAFSSSKNGDDRRITLNGAVHHPHTIIDSTYAVETSDYYITLKSGSSGTITSVLPLITPHEKGRELVFKNLSVANFYISPTAPDKIDGATTKLLSNVYSSLTIICSVSSSIGPSGQSTGSWDIISGYNL